MFPEVVERLLGQTYQGSIDLLFSLDNPHPGLANAGRNIQLNYEKMRQLVISEGYNKAWIVESDTIPPVDALERLMAVDAPVVSGLYALRQGSRPPNLFFKGTSGMGQVLNWDQVKANWGKVIEVGGSCMGCILFDRTVLEKWTFQRSDYFLAPDMPMMNWMCKEEIKQMADVGVVCGHKASNGEIIWPDKDEPLGFRIEKTNGSYR